MTDSITFGPLDETTLREQVLLFNKVFEKKISDNEWRYINYENPLSEDNLYGAFDGDKLIGLNCFMAMQYTYNGHNYYALQSCNSAVDPDYRGKGIFTRIINSAIEHYSDGKYDFIIGTPNPNSHPAFQKMGWTDIADLHYLILQLNTNTIVKRVMKLNLPRFMNIFAGWLSLKSKLFSHVIDDMILYRSNTLNEEDASYISSESRNTLTFTNTYDNLKWRLAHPQYVYYTVKNNDTNKPVAFFVVREHPYVSIIGSTADVLETCYISDDIKELKSAYGIFVRELRKKFDIIWMWKSLNSKNEKKILKSAGFFDLHIRTPYICKVLTSDVDKKKIFEDINFWNPQEIEFDTVVQYIEK